MTTTTTVKPRTIFPSREAFIDALEYARSTGNTSFARGADISGLDLSGLDLSRVDMKRCLAAGTDFSYATMYGTKLHRGDFTGARFNGAQMIRVSARRARFVLAELCDVQCAKTDFSGSNFTGAWLDGIRAKQTVFCDARFVDAQLINAVLTKCHFNGADLTRTIVFRASVGSAAAVECVISVVRENTSVDANAHDASQAIQHVLDTVQRTGAPR